MSETGFKPGVLRALVNAGYADHLSRLRVTPTERSREIAAYTVRAAALLELVIGPTSHRALALAIHDRLKTIAERFPNKVGEPSDPDAALASVLLLTSQRVPSLSSIRRWLKRGTA